MGMTFKRTAACAALMLALALGGCAAQPQESETSAPTPIATEEASTVAQWASLIAKQQAGWDEWQGKWDAARCSSITAGMPDGITCRLMLLSASFAASTTAIEYQLATGEGKKGFIAAEPPEEISNLFDSTVAAATAADEAGKAFVEAGCDTEAATDCAGLAFTFESALDDLRSEFAAWRPYM